MAEVKQSDVQMVGNEIGGFIGGVLNPVIGGTTTTSVTTKPSADSSKTTTIIIVVVVVVIALVGFFIYKQNKK